MQFLIKALKLQKHHSIYGIEEYSQSLAIICQSIC